MNQKKVMGKIETKAQQDLSERGTSEQVSSWMF